MLRFISVLSLTLLVLLAAAFGRQQKMTKQPGGIKPTSLNSKTQPAMKHPSLQKASMRDVPSKAPQEAGLCCNETLKSLTAVKLANDILIALAKDLQAKLESSCQRPPTNIAKCLPGFTYLPSAEKCYMPVYESLDWSSAGKKCQKLRNDANLAVIETRRQNDAVKAFLVSELSKNGANPACIPKENPEYGSFFWTSGQRLNESCQSSFVWKPSNGERLALKLEDWISFDPDCLGRNEFCLDLWSSYGFAWNDDPCTKKTCSLCEYKP